MTISDRCKELAAQVLGFRTYREADEARGLMEAVRGGTSNAIQAGLLEERDALRSLVVHCWIHSSYPNCGYSEMDREMRQLYDRTARGSVEE